MSVLTRDEAQTRAHLLDVHRYTIELDLTTGDETFDSRTAIRFSVRADAADTDTFIEIKPAELRSATLDGHPLDPHTLDQNRLPLKNLTAGEHNLHIDARMRYSRTGEGMHRFTDPADGETYLYTQLFLDDAQRVFAAFDQPDLKATFDLTVTAPEDWTVLANGITEHLGEGHWRATTTPRISTYLLAVAAGPWHSVRTEHRGLPESFETIRTSLSGLPDTLTRAVVWNALRDTVRDGELPPTTYLDIARAHLPHETDIALTQGVLTFATTQITDRYLTPEQRPAALTTLTSLCRDLIRRTEDGENPGLRLIAVRHLIDTAAHPDTIAAWLTDGTVPGGPELDPELRWRILARLAVLGATDESTITAELDRDPSATGQEGAAHCRAALPDPEAKHAAWAAMFTTDERTDLSNYLFKATAQGFWQPEQTDLVRQYVPRYYPDAVALAARRGPAIASTVGRWAFPAHAVDADNLTLGEACLRDAQPTPALRRTLADELDDLARALRVRQA